LAVIVFVNGCAPKPQNIAHPGFRVALLTPGPVSDAGWNASAFERLQLIKSRLGAETAMVQTTSPADFDDAFRDFGSRGFSLIFANGFEYTEAAIQAGRDFSTRSLSSAPAIVPPRTSLRSPLHWSKPPTAKVCWPG
jgi:basic membrane lipoprotein Med (substrate-binding protein (PBP1-ABC) superfamily)